MSYVENDPHVRAVNAFIPAACSVADRAVEAALSTEFPLSGAEQRRLWDRVFHAEMDTLTISNELRHKAPRDVGGNGTA